MKCQQCDTEAHAIVDRLHTLRPAAEYHEDMGDVLWWWLPIEIEQPPVVENGTDWMMLLSVGPTHFSPLPQPELLTASDGAEVTR